MLDDIKSLLDVGLPLIPLCTFDHSLMSQKHLERCKRPGKMPLIKDWQTHNSTTMKDINSWISQFKRFNVGMPLGDASGYCGIDVDGQEGVQLLIDMSGGDLPSTWEFSTAAGSRLLYKIPPGIRTKKFKQSGEGAHEECALLCTGQQTVMPPSVHHTGHRYTWVEDHSPKDMDCAMAPEWLVALIKLEDSVVPIPAVPKNPEPTTFNFADEFDVPGDVDSVAGGQEFALSDYMLLDLPEDLPEIKRKSKGSKGKGPAVVVTDDMLTEMIPEGSRDNTMTAIVGHYCANRDLRRLGKQMILDICNKHNEQYCDPPLESQAILDKVNYFFDMEVQKDAAYAQQKTEKIQFEPSRMVRKVLEYLEKKNIILRYDQFSKMYYYTNVDEGPWQCLKGHVLINKWIRDVITSPHYGGVQFDSKRHVEETRTAMEEHFTVPFKKISDFDLGEHSRQLSKMIVVPGGMVDWRKKKLVAWNPDYKTTIAFEVDYDPDAECPRFEQYLSEWLPDKYTRMVIQEFMGYCLIPNANFRKALFLYGKGKNGKSVFVEFFQKFFGEHKATLSYDALFQRFGIANLKGKLVNIYDDTSVSFTKDTGIAKNLIAGGTLSAEFKGKDHFTFTNVSRIIFSAQETPRTADNTLAWYDRWYFVKFPNTFRTSEAKKQEISRALVEETPGIFNWMIEGLTRLMDQDGFTQSNELDEYTNEYRSFNDSVMSFVRNYCRLTDDLEKSERVSTSHLYEVYVLLMEKEHLRPLSKKMFRLRLEDAGFAVTQGATSTSSRTYYFKGLSLDYDKEDLRQYLLEVRVILSQEG